MEIHVVLYNVLALPPPTLTDSSGTLVDFAQLWLWSHFSAMPETLIASVAHLGLRQQWTCQAVGTDR
jgi:hypothetical protein